MKIAFRKCPHCGYRYPLKKYITTVFLKTYGQSWGCDNCGKPVKLHSGRHTLVIGLQAIWLMAILMVKNDFFEGIMWFLVFLVVLLIGLFCISLLDTFAVGE